MKGAFVIKQKKSPFQKHKEEEEAKKKVTTDPWRIVSAAVAYTQERIARRLSGNQRPTEWADLFFSARMRKLRKYTKSSLPRSRRTTLYLEGKLSFVEAW